MSDVADSSEHIFDYPLATGGVNLYSSLVDVLPDEALLTKNCYYKDGIIKREGSSKLDSAEVAASKKITGLHRFYYGSGNKQLLVSAGTVVSRYTGSGYTNIKTGWTDGQPVSMVTWGALDKVFIANGLDTPFTWNGTTATDLSASNYPTKAIQFLPYQDRLLAIDDNNPGDLTWSASFDETAAWETVSACGVRVDGRINGMVHHSVNNASSGIESKVLLAGSNGMYIFHATDLRTPSVTGDYTLFSLGTSIGCDAPNTMKWTPKGTIYLGTDGHVYLLAFDATIPIPISTKIESNDSARQGIENIPAAQKTNACAVFHNGFYILSVAQSGETTNSTQWWLDVDRLYQDERGYWGPWYGPMKGQAISVFAVQSGANDSNELMGGESNGSTGGFVYQLRQNSLFGDAGNSITVQYKTYYNELGGRSFLKNIEKVELWILENDASLTIDFDNRISTSMTFESPTLGDDPVFFNEKNWGSFYWNDDIVQFSSYYMDNEITGRTLSLIIDHDTSSNDFQVTNMKVLASIDRIPFGG